MIIEFSSSPSATAAAIAQYCYCSILNVVNCQKWFDAFQLLSGSASDL